MKKLLILVFFLSTIALAQDDTTTNSNNTNTSTQSNVIDQHDTVTNNSTDSSTHDSHAVDNSVDSGMHTTSNSNNQANVSTQTINNTNTEGDLDQSKNTNSFNSNTGNSNGSNVTQSPEAKAGALAIVGGNQVGVRTGSTQVNTGGTNVAIANNQVRQTPMAWSPAIAMSQSQELCNVSASLGLAFAGAAGSAGVPIKDGDCNRRRDAIFWMNVGMAETACQRMIQDDDNRKAMESSGATCRSVAQAQVRQAMLIPSTLNVPQNPYWDKQDKIADAQLSALYKQRMVK
jgi:hypothetical protein